MNSSDNLKVNKCRTAANDRWKKLSRCEYVQRTHRKPLQRYNNFITFCSSSSFSLCPLFILLSFRFLNNRNEDSRKTACACQKKERNGKPEEAHHSHLSSSIIVWRCQLTPKKQESDFWPRKRKCWRRQNDQMAYKLPLSFAIHSISIQFNFIFSTDNECPEFTRTIVSGPHAYTLSRTQKVPTFSYSFVDLNFLFLYCFCRSTATDVQTYQEQKMNYSVTDHDADTKLNRKSQFSILVYRKTKQTKDRKWKRARKNNSKKICQSFYCEFFGLNFVMFGRLRWSIVFGRKKKSMTIELWKRWMEKCTLCVSLGFYSVHEWRCYRRLRRFWTGKWTN